MLKTIDKLWITVRADSSTSMKIKYISDRDIEGRDEALDINVPTFNMANREKTSILNVIMMILKLDYNQLSTTTI
jgi:hypothetical protein